MFSGALGSTWKGRNVLLEADDTCYPFVAALEDADEDAMGKHWHTDHYHIIIHRVDGRLNILLPVPNKGRCLSNQTIPPNVELIALPERASGCCSQRHRTQESGHHLKTFSRLTDNMLSFSLLISYRTFAEDSEIKYISYVFSNWDIMATFPP